MLTRNAAVRKQRRHTARVLAASFAQLNLPWLAPAQLRWSASQASPDSPSPPRKPRRTRVTPVQQTRCLATEASTVQWQPALPPRPFAPAEYSSGNAFRNTQDRHVPWAVARAEPKSALSNIRPYNDPIVINTTLQDPAKVIKVAHGVGGTAIELLQHLHTALQIGRLPRAEAIIQRMYDICAPSSAELHHAHRAYLEQYLRRLKSQAHEDAVHDLQAMQKWFEVEVRNRGVFVDTKLLIVMIRASIWALNGSQRERSVRRYVNMAKEMGEDQYYEVLESEDYDDNEFTIVGSLTYEGGQSAQTQVAAEAQVVTEELVKMHPTYRRPDTLQEGDLPAVLATEQTGEGLRSVIRTLETFIATPSLPTDATLEAQHEQALKRQQILEETSVDVAIERWRKADQNLRKLGIQTAMQSKPIGALMWQWHQALLPALEAERAECRKLDISTTGRDHDRYHYGPYLELLPLDKMAASTILYTLSKMHAGKNRDTGKYEQEVKLTRLTMGLAKNIEQECKVNEVRSKRGAIDKNNPRGLTRRGLREYRLQRQQASEKQTKLEREQQKIIAQLEWPLEAKVKLGAFLITKLIECAQLPVTRQHPRTNEKMTQMQPAFLHRSKYERGKRVGLLCSNPDLVDKMETEPPGDLIAKRMPMVVEPKPWKGWADGGYMHYSNAIMRLSVGDSSGKDYFQAAHKRGDMSQIYAGLSALGEVPWKIHHGVFKVQLEAWNSGEEIANFAPLNPTFDVPSEPPEGMPRHKWLAELREVENKRGGLHSKRCFQNFQLEIARTMVNETMYFPHNMDFRGRAYPIPPYLNHMGADNVRGVLVFAKGRPLGETGLRWLKIHLATVAGHDKASMAERIDFTEKHLDDIYDSVRNPLKGRRWWLQAEDAWQTLAACFELTEALDSPDPTKFISHLPVQQDGTCNGLQHYAALGGDKIGAAQVNLEPGDRPADVYTAVAEAVKEEVRKDAAHGNAIAQKLNGRLTRKCVKQPVMTNVYGVTYYGAKEQVRRQLEVLFPEVKKYDDINLGHMSQYIATKIFKSLGEMFAGAQAIQTWLGQCADRISTCLTPEQIAALTSKGKEKESGEEAKKGIKAKRKKIEPETKFRAQAGKGTLASDKETAAASKPLFKSTVVWTTPLRLPVVQPYRAPAKGRMVKTNLQAIYLQDPQVWHPVSKRKQLQAFPPNFIHSLDATHMLLSALKCKEAGLTFASIHDSFWTHACDVDGLSRVLRDAFIEMHSDDIVGRLREEFETRYKGCMYLASVDAKSAAGKRITELRKKSKRGGSDELALEVERLRLLNSEKATDRKKGKALHTPGAVLAADGVEAALVAPAEIESQQLGAIPSGAEMDEANIGPEAEDATEDMVEEEEADQLATEGGDLANAEADTDPSRRKEAIEQALGKQGKPKQPAKRKVYAWLPLVFPPVPPKGEFDVRKIRESNYFFH